MLTKETKDRIDRARQILVGQLPLPSDQIELITIALIYKFMDDMDEQARELGGQPSFFVGKLRDYAWREVVANKLGAEERITRFIHGIEELSKPENRHLPDLFQSIFRNTFLKFRDGRTLKLFLDEINGFSYDHSEELGNAFEYLLDCMGTQADNGQFRTPRNIIDFVAGVVDPRIGQTILDPACGTAGFLISAFRHILEANTAEPEAGRPRRPGDRLTAEQKQQLTRDIVGYDITPLMCRLSRVNMYLHQFANPVIHEYDTITNTARWGEKFDVILANPPFMSPHGGNQTHDKFRIAANRTEVLFADYILEHLLPDGRAGFIVPEGIIFQNQGDYVSLRKWMIEEGGLWAVASLPAGVFQPYSGVKTSVLFVDRALARKRGDVLLLKIENDGFSLNTNRNPIPEDDLPAALELLRVAKSDDYAVKLLALGSPIAHRVVSRADFARIEAYRSGSAAWDFCRKRHAKLKRTEADLVALKAAPDSDTRVTARAERALAKMREEFLTDTGLPTVPNDGAALMAEFEARVRTAAIAYGDEPKVSTMLASGLRECLDEQREYNLAFEQGKVVASNSGGGAFDWVRVGDLCECRNGRAFKPSDWTRKENGGLPIVRIQNLNDPSAEMNYFAGNVDERFVIEHGDLLFSWSGSRGTSFGPHIWGRGRAILNQHIFRLDHTARVDRQYFFWALKRLTEDVERNLHGGVGLVHITKGKFEALTLPLPSVDEQRSIVAEIESYQRVVDGCAAILASYRPRIPENLDWPRIRLGDVCELDPKRPALDLPDDTPVPFLPMADLGVRAALVQPIQVRPLKQVLKGYTYFGSGDVLVAKITPCFENGKMGLIGSIENGIGFGSTEYYVLRSRGELMPEFLFFALCDPSFVALGERSMTGAGGQQRLTKDFVRDFQVPVPSLETQSLIVAQLQREQATLTGVSEMKAKHEARIRARLAAVWGEPPDAPA